MTFENLKSNNINIRAKIEGSGPLIVLVHGCPESWVSWRHQIPLLAEKGFTVAAIDVRGYADFAPMGHSVRVRREEEKGTISWKIKFRNGTEKDFVSPITTKPWGKFIPKLADGDMPNQGEINSQILYSEPEGLNTNKELPKVEKSVFKKGVYY